MKEPLYWLICKAFSSLRSCQWFLDPQREGEISPWLSFVLDSSQILLNLRQLCSRPFSNLPQLLFLIFEDNLAIKFAFHSIPLNPVFVFSGTALIRHSKPSWSCWDQALEGSRDFGMETGGSKTSTVESLIMRNSEETKHCLIIHAYVLGEKLNN